MYWSQGKTSAELADDFGISRADFNVFDGVFTVFNVASVMATHKHALEIAPDQGVEVNDLADLASGDHEVEFSDQEFDTVFNGVVADMDTKIDGFVSLTSDGKNQTKELFGNLGDDKKRILFDNAISSHRALNLNYITLENS